MEEKSEFIRNYRKKVAEIEQIVKKYAKREMGAICQNYVRDGCER